MLSYLALGVISNLNSDYFISLDTHWGNRGLVCCGMGGGLLP